MQADLFAPAKVERGAWPSEQLAAYLNGGEEPSAAIRSWARFYIWDAATQICAMPTMDKRRTALGKLPAAIRPLVQADMIRIWG